MTKMTRKKTTMNGKRTRRNEVPETRKPVKKRQQKYQHLKLNWARENVAVRYAKFTILLNVAS